MVKNPPPKSYKALHESVPENKQRHRTECKNRLRMKASQPAKDENCKQTEIIQSSSSSQLLTPISYAKWTLQTINGLCSQIKCTKLNSFTALF